jgi:hypothetical protein
VQVSARYAGSPWEQIGVPQIISIEILVERSHLLKRSSHEMILPTLNISSSAPVSVPHESYYVPNLALVVTTRGGGAKKKLLED